MTKIYLVTNPRIKGIKIGKTNQTIRQRLRGLDNTSVPARFVCDYAVDIPDKKTANAVEKKIHKGLDDYRINSNREFFDIKPELAKAILEIIELMGGTVVNLEEDATANSQASAKPATRTTRAGVKRSNFKFSSLGIQKGEVLHFKGDEKITCEVVADGLVQFHGITMSTTKAAKQVLGKKTGVNGNEYWCINGKTLRKRRLEAE